MPAERSPVTSGRAVSRGVSDKPRKPSSSRSARISSSDPWKAVSGQHQDTAFHGSDDEILADLELLGFLGLSDTPRDTARPLVTGLRSAGIRPVMLTGDHPSTAHAIAVSLGWPEDTIVVTGDELAALDRRARVDALREAGIVARV